MPDLKVTIDGDAARLEREIKRTENLIRGLDRELGKANKTADTFNRQLAAERARAVDMLGKSMVAFGAATLAGLGLATKAAIDWESAWAGVRKVVKGTPEQLAALEGELRELATTLPASHREIAAVAAAAGQLGVARQDITAFTKVMIDLAATTNLTADEAATSIAQLMNIMQTAPDEVDNLGAALVALGNNGASTERDIIQMAQRIAAAGKLVNLSEADVLAFANALASVGVEAEAGGSALSRVIADIGKAVATGGEKLDMFAKTAGVSSAEFARAFREDPADAITTFIEGLGRINAAGGDVFTILDQIGLSDVRVSRALLSMATAGDLLRESLGLSADEWQKNTALISEAEKRYDTAAAKIQIARNALVDLAIDIGNTLLPVVANLADSAADLIGWIADLPAPLKAAATVLGVLAGGAALAGGGFLLMAPRIVAAHEAMTLLAVSSPRAAAGLSLAAKAMKAFGLAVIAVTATTALHDWFFQSAADISDFVRETERIGGPDVQGRINALTKELEEQQRIASRGVNLFERIYSDQGAADARERVDAIKERLEVLKAEQEDTAKVAADAAGITVDALTEIASAFGFVGEEATKEAGDMLSSWADATAEFVSLSGAYEMVLAAKQEAERESAQATADATSSSADSWEDYVKDVDVTLQEYLTQLEEMIAAQENWATNLAQVATRVPAAVLDELARLGPEGAPLVADLVNATDEEMARFIEAMDRKSELGSAAFATNLAAAQPELQRIAATLGQETANKLAVAIAQGAPDVRSAAARLGISIDQGVGVNRPRRVVVGTDLNERSVRYVRGVLDALATPRWVTFNARTGSRITSGGLLVGTGQTGGKVPGVATQPFGLIAHGTEWVIRPEASAFYGDEMLRAINEMRWPKTGAMSITAPSSAGPASVGPVGVRVFIGDREIRDIVRVEVDTQSRATARGADLYARAG